MEKKLIFDVEPEKIHVNDIDIYSIIYAMKQGQMIAVITYLMNEEYWFIRYKKGFDTVHNLSALKDIGALEYCEFLVKEWF